MVSKALTLRPAVPPASSEAARKRMKAAKGRDTRAELQIRSHLHRMGLRFRVQERLLEGLRRRVDIVFKPVRIAIYVDGCFWHGCPIHGTWPKENAAFWRDKIETNRRRDADTDARLASAGWTVLRFWEHENSLLVAERIAKIVRKRRAAKVYSSREK